MSNVTKRALEASLKRLLLQKPLTKITINDITEDCGVSRMTFYYHFKDIYDLIEWCCIEDGARALQGKKTSDTWKEGLMNVFQVMMENKSFILNVYRNVSHEQIHNYLCKLMHGLILNVVEEKSKGMDVRTKDKQMIADFYEYAFVGVLLSWINQDMKEDPEYLVGCIARILQGNLRRALEEFAVKE